MSFNVPSVMYFYGLSGAGKNFVGDIAGRLTGGYVYHADVDLTPEMLLAISEKRPFSAEMRDRFYAIVADRIIYLQSQHDHVIVSQATYKRRHRDYLLSRVSDMDMICVTAEDAVIIERLQKRGDAVTPSYAAVIRSNFEAPAAGAKIIENDEGEFEIVRQLMTLYPDQMWEKKLAAAKAEAATG